MKKSSLESKEQTDETGSEEQKFTQSYQIHETFQQLECLPIITRLL